MCRHAFRFPQVLFRRHFSCDGLAEIDGLRELSRDGVDGADGLEGEVVGAGAVVALRAHAVVKLEVEYRVAAREERVVHVNRVRVVGELLVAHRVHRLLILARDRLVVNRERVAVEQDSVGIERHECVPPALVAVIRSVGHFQLVAHRRHRALGLDALEVASDFGEERVRLRLRRLGSGRRLRVELFVRLAVELRHVVVPPLNRLLGGLAVRKFR